MQKNIFIHILKHMLSYVKDSDILFLYILGEIDFSSTRPGLSCTSCTSDTYITVLPSEA
jgi:hypothetical protein